MTEVKYAAGHHRDLGSQGAEPGIAPFMHLGEYDAPSFAPDDRASFERAQRRLTENVLALAGPLDGAHVLEVGCGFGGNLALLAAEGRAARLVGLDLGERQIAWAERSVTETAGARLEWLVGDACALPFADHAFDVVLAIECAFHFSDRARFAAEARRVLRPSGRLVLTDLVGGAKAGDADERLLDLLRDALAPFGDPLGPASGWLACGAEAGLVTTSREDLTAAVLPSFDFILHGKSRDPWSLRDPSDRGAAGLALALERGLLAVERMAFRRPPDPASDQPPES